ncbi:hypothetical protein [Streptomyces sp. NPDC001070]
MPDAERHLALEEMEIGTLFAALADRHRREVVRDADRPETPR